MFRLSRKKIIISLIIVVLGVGAYFAIRFFRGREEVVQEGPPTVAERLSNKPILSSSGEELKQKLIEPLGGPGPLYETADFRIGWLPPPIDRFDVTIKTTDFVSAKEETVVWLKAKGFTEQDICALPVVFNLAWEVQQELEGSGYTFNRFPDFCQY